MPVFSIVTVCRNAGGTLRHAMNSLASQSFADYEWIVVDGASTDDTVGIASEFPREFMTLVSEPDDGIYHAMNKAVRLARGDFVFFLNADDSFQDERVLENTFAELERDDSVDFLYGTVVVTGAEGEEIWRWSPPLPEDLLSFLFSTGLPHQGCFARRHLFDGTIGLFREDLRIAGDYDWLVRLALCDGVRARRLPFVVACFQKGGASSDSAKTFEETCRVQDEHPEFFERLGLGTIVGLFREQTSTLRRELEIALGESHKLRERNQSLKKKIEALKASIAASRAGPPRQTKSWLRRLFS